MLEFMKQTPHKHTFVEGICKFCQIDTKKCKHDKLNFVEKGEGNGMIKFSCTCGEERSVICYHSQVYVDRYSQGDDDDTYYCSRCKTNITI
jgi:hypothetical protein